MLSRSQPHHDAYEALLPLALVFDIVFPLLHVIPPSLEVLETLRTGKVGHDFHSDNGTDARETFRVIAPEQIRYRDEPVPSETHLPRQIGCEKAFDVFGIIEKILEALRRAEEKHIVVIRDDPVDQSQPSQLCTLSFGLHRRRHIGYSEQPQ